MHMRFPQDYGKCSPNGRRVPAIYSMLARSGKVVPNGPLTVVPQKDLFIRNACISFDLNETSMKPIKLLLEYTPHQAENPIEVVVATFVLYHVLSISQFVQLLL